MARYKVLVQSFINDALVQEDDIVTLDDGVEVSENLELIPEVKEVKK
jgi:hypothetical protein